MSLISTVVLSPSTFVSSPQMSFSLYKPAKRSSGSQAIMVGAGLYSYYYFGYSLAGGGSMALNFLADRFGAQETPPLPVFDHGVSFSFWKVAAGPYSMIRQQPRTSRVPTTTLKLTATTSPTPCSPLFKERRYYSKLAFGLIAAMTAPVLIGSAYVVYYLGGNTPPPASSSFSSSTDNYSPNNQRDWSRDISQSSEPAPWPLPPQRPSGNQPPNRNSNDIGPAQDDVADKLCGQATWRFPIRDGAPPPPPPPPPLPSSLDGFIHDFPKPQNFEEFLALNIILGALCAWTLKQLIRFLFRGRRGQHRNANDAAAKISENESMDTITTTPIAKLPLLLPDPTRAKTSDRLGAALSRSGVLEKQPQLPSVQQRGGSVEILLIFITFALAGSGSGSLLIFRFKSRDQAIQTKHDTNRPLDSYHVHDEHPTYASRTDWNNDGMMTIPTVSTTPSAAAVAMTSPVKSRRRPSTTTIITRSGRDHSNDRVRLSKVEQVKYFYKDEIIGFDNGPPLLRRE